MIGKMEREQLESHLIEFAEAYTPWAVLLVVTNTLKPLLKDVLKGPLKAKHEIDPHCPKCLGAGQYGSNAVTVPCECVLPGISAEEVSRRVELIRGHLAREDKLADCVSRMSDQNVRLIGKVDMLSTAMFEAMRQVRDGSTAAAVATLEEAMHEANQSPDGRT